MCWPLSIGPSDQGEAVAKCTPASSLCTKRLAGERRGGLRQFVTNALKERLGEQDLDPSPGRTVHLL